MAESEQAAKSKQGYIAIFQRALVAFVIPFTVWLFNYSQQQYNIENDQRLEQDTIVSTYIDDMTSLMIHPDYNANVELSECGSSIAKELQTQTTMERLIRGRTVLALSQLQDGVRRGQVLRFFVDSGLSHLLQPNDLISQDYSEADFVNICLSGLVFWDANLSGANLLATNLSYTDLWNANLSGANLSVTTLLGTDLWNANLTGADLSGADLSGTNLSGANLENVQFNEKTTLPDGELWTSTTDMTRYTNPEHSNYWNPCFESDIWYCQ